MTTEQVGSFRCDACNMEFDSMKALIEHNVEQPPGTTADAVLADV